MLSNNEGKKIAVVVNDVASVNIDSKIVRGQTVSQDTNGVNVEMKSEEEAPSLPAGIVELQNGCACCSISGELLSSVSELMTLSDMRQEDERFDHIVIEMSGIAEPRSVRNIFQEAMMYDMPLLERVNLDTLVTVVDCSTYLDYLQSLKLANMKEAPELFRDGVDKNTGEDWMRGVPSSLVDALTNDESGYEGGVSDLLVEQTEVADLVLLNKVDILEGDLEDTKQIVTALNPRAKIISTSFGKANLDDILGITNGEGVAIDGVVDDHKEFVNAAESHTHDHSHNSHHDKSDDSAEDCTDPACTDTSHSHSHNHSSETSKESCTDPTCTDTSHSHSHSHSSEQASDCTDPTCTDSSHSHSHSHSSDTSKDSCSDPDCTDTSHSHSHSHSSETPTHANIGSFVYRARRPFHPRRLVSILQKLPVVRGVPTGQMESGDGEDEASTKAFKNVLRSKGFAWVADSNVKALYWSHAGSSFEMQCLGRWWTTLPRSQWPEEAKESILADFDSIDHDESNASTTSETVGDRRQEIVFIGPGVGDAQTIIREKLDACLLTDAEWDVYRTNRDDEASLACFENPLQTRMLTY